MAIDYAPVIKGPIPSIYKDDLTGSAVKITIPFEHSPLANEEDKKKIIIKYTLLEGKGSSLSSKILGSITGLTSPLKPKFFDTDTFPTGSCSYKVQLAYGSVINTDTVWSSAKIVKYYHANAPTGALSTSKSWVYEISGVQDTDKVVAYRYGDEATWQNEYLTGNKILLSPVGFCKKENIEFKLQSGRVIVKTIASESGPTYTPSSTLIDSERGLIVFPDGQDVPSYIGDGPYAYLSFDKTQILYWGQSYNVFIWNLQPQPTSPIKLLRLSCETRNGVPFIKQTVVQLNTALDYEYSYLCDKDNTLSLKYNGLASSFKRTIQEQKVDTLGGEYPFIFRNGDSRYAEIPLSTFIASDLGPLNNIDYLTESEEYRTTTPQSGVASNTLASKYQKELEYRNEVYSWLTNGKPKVFKSPTEGVFVVQVMNVSMSPEKGLGNLLSTVSGTMYEVDSLSHYSEKQFMEAIS